MAGRATAPLQSSSAAAAEVNGTEADLHGIAEDATGLTLAKPTRNPSNGRKRDKPDESTTSWRGSSGGASPGPSQPTSQPRSKRGRTPLRGSSPAVQSSQEPGGKSAYEQWLEENQQVVEEAPLIEELQEEAPHEPTSEELASDAAFAEFAALLPGLTPAKDSISDATSAALRAAAAGAGLRAVRAVVDAVAECPDSRQRLPHLYLLDSIVKREARQAKEEGSEGDGAAPVVFPRAVGAALPRLMNLLLGDDYVEAKLQKILTIWRAQGLVTEGLVDAAMETMVAHAAHVAAEAAAAAAKEEEQAALSEEELLDLMRATPMDAKLTLRYTMPVSTVPLRPAFCIDLYKHFCLLDFTMLPLLGSLPSRAMRLC